MCQNGKKRYVVVVFFLFVGAVVLPVELASELIESLRCKGIYYNMAIIIILIVAVVVARKQLLHGRNKMNAREGN